MTTIRSLVFLFLVWPNCYASKSPDEIQEGCFLRYLKFNEFVGYNVILKTSNVLRQPAIFGSTEFFATTTFSLSFKTSRLSQTSCVAYVIPSITPFTDVAVLMTRSGFMFTEKAWFILITEHKSRVDDELWKKFEIGVDDPDEFPALYTKLIFVWKKLDQSEEIYCYCWLCGQNERFQIFGLGSLQASKLEEFHKKLNWVGRGIVTNVIGPYETHNSEKSYCMKELVKDMYRCDRLQNLLVIIWRRLNVTARNVQSDATEEEFDHTLYSVWQSGENDPFKESTNSIIILVQEWMNFYYCYNLENFLQPRWGLLLEPLDVYIWLLLLAVFAIVVAEAIRKLVKKLFE